ncbi:MAG: LTA synthase family protein [Candidatus Choladocola sp.]|nr:LTA synthase family protein [Candidatus Choladocola sp.]
MKLLHLKKNRKKTVAAVGVTAAMLIITALAAAGEGMNAVALAASLLLTAGAVILVLRDISYGKILSFILYLILPAAALTALENYTHVIRDLEPLILLLNLLFFYILYGMMIFLTGRFGTGCCIATMVPMVFGLANYYVVSFRSSPIVPWDFLSIGTAATVADNYSFTLTWKAAFVLFAFIWIMVISSKSAVRFCRKRVRFGGAALYLLCMVLYVNGIQKSSVQDFFGMDTTLFTLNVLYRNNGIAAAFLGNLRFLHIEEPDGYSPDKAEAIAADAAGKAKQQENSGQGTEEYPNVIIIMDEAFSDLSVWGDFETSEEVMPYFKSLQEEGVGGEVYVSVKGGSTANTEFELLTGDTMGFLPAGSIPYQQYINSETPSLASYLKSLGYSTTAIHPYYTSGWDRDEVYEYFGFDEFLGIHSFDNPERLRGYVSDESAFDKIREQFELKGDGRKTFIFEVTMQNHGGYSKENPDFDIYLSLPEAENKTTSVVATEKYLTLMNETDRALEKLVEYFREQEEPVILLMFGDHQPSDYITNAIQRICGTESEDTLAFSQQGYRVPFVIWSNCGLEHRYYDGISVNYLGGLLMELAGIPQTGYQQFLRQLQEKLPVISGNVYRDADGNFYAYGDDAYADLLNEYQILQYNHLVDGKNRISGFFGS